MHRWLKHSVTDCMHAACRYIFTTPQARKDVISSLMQYRDLLMQLPHGERTAYSLNGAPVELVTLNSSEWSVPHAAPDLQDTSLWHATRWGESYRLMVRTASWWYCTCMEACACACKRAEGNVAVAASLVILHCVCVRRTLCVI